MTKRIAIFAVAVLAFIAARVLVTRGKTEYQLRTWSGNSPYERALVRALRAEGAFDEFVRFVRQPDSPEAVHDSAALLSRRGLMRLTADDQSRRLAILDRVLSALPAVTCAAYHRGEEPTATSQAVIRAMDSVSLDAFTALVARSMIAEFRQTPLPATASEADITTFIERVADGLSADARSRFIQALSEPGRATPDDMCWAGRALYRGALSFQGADRTNFVRIMTAIEASVPPPVAK